MNYNNAVYVTDNKVYYKDKQAIIEFKYPKDIIRELNKEQFIKEYIRSLKNNHIKPLFFYKHITLIYDSLLSRHDLSYLQNLFYEIGYRKVCLKSDISCLHIRKKHAFLIIGQNDKLLYRDAYNQVKQLLLNKNILTKQERNMIIQKRVKDSLTIIGPLQETPFFKNHYLIENKGQFFLESSI